MTLEEAAEAITPCTRVFVCLFPDYVWHEITHSPTKVSALVWRLFDGESVLRIDPPTVESK